MRPGQFGGNLIPTTPRTIRAQIEDAVNQRDGSIVVFDTRAPIPRLEYARYVGFLTKRHEGGGFSGHGWAGVLQSDDNLGKHLQSAPTFAVGSDLNDFVSFVLPYGGIFSGIIILTGLAQISGTWSIGLGAREFLDAVCAQVNGAHWRITPTGAFNAALPSILYPTDPRVVVSVDYNTQTGKVRGIRGRAVRFSEDASQVTSQAVAYGQRPVQAQIPSAVSADTSVVWDYSGSAYTQRRVINSPSTPSGAQLQAVADKAKSQYGVARQVFDVQIDPGGDIQRFMATGDPMWVHDLDNGVYGDAPAGWSASNIRPVKVWMSEMTWQTHPGQGVWLLRRGEYLDISAWIEYGDGSAICRVSDDVDAMVPAGSPNRLENGAVGIDRPASVSGLRQAVRNPSNPAVSTSTPSGPFVINGPAQVGIR